MEIFREFPDALTDGNDVSEDYDEEDPIEIEVEYLVTSEDEQPWMAQPWLNRWRQFFFSSSHSLVAFIFTDSASVVTSAKSAAARLQLFPLQLFTLKYSF